MPTRSALLDYGRGRNFDFATVAPQQRLGVVDYKTPFTRRDRSKLKNHDLVRFFFFSTGSIRVSSLAASISASLESTILRRSPRLLLSSARLDDALRVTADTSTLVAPSCLEASVARTTKNVSSRDPADGAI